MKTRVKSREKAQTKKRRNVSAIEDDGNGNSDNCNITCKPYVCVYCGTPCAVLYRQLTNSLSSIKAMHCERCQRIVDPYIEREWLLVVIDCILLRPESYRHILYNNEYLSWHGVAQSSNKRNTSQKEVQEGEEEKNSRTITTTTTLMTTVTIKRLIQWTFASSMFHAYLKRQTLVHEHQHAKREYQDSMAFTGLENDDDSSTTLVYGIFVFTSVLDLVVQWLTIYGYLKLISTLSTLLPSSSSLPPPSDVSSDNSEDDIGQRKTKTMDKQQTKDEATLTPSPPPPPHNLAYQLYLALLLPTSFQVLSVLVLIWENSKTTRALGSLLVTCGQSLAISLISIHHSRNYYCRYSNSCRSNINNNSNSSELSRMFRSFTPLLVGVVSLIAWRFGVGHFLLAICKTAPYISFNPLCHRIPCVGFEMDANVINTNGEFGSLGERSTPPLLLCLT
mmetsp:Transcript_9261/g.18447  ORF Transcript_9261/g.18447 Transcript_9261/m.18447 type:complete len:448 (+) Transcript_9261:174-1517(+)